MFVVSLGYNLTMNSRFISGFDRVFINWMHRWGISILRVVLGIVFLWFGLLKVFNVSPVVSMVHIAYSFFPSYFILVLGVWEAVIGIGLIFKISLRFTLALLWLQMAGTLVALALAPAIFFNHGNFLLLTTEGEFVVKNIVLIAASLVIGGYQVKRRD